MKRFFALILAGLLLLGLTACIDSGGDKPTTTPAPTTTAAPGPFAAARRIVATDDLRYDNDNNPIVEQGEVLVRFHYMDTFDVETWKASTVIQVAWDIEAITHAVYLDMGTAPTRIDPYALSQAEEYDFGVAVSEIWILPEDAYTAAFHALEAEAKGAEAKEFWLVPKNYSGILCPKYDADTSIRVDSFLPEQLRPNAEPIHMSTALMRKHFPFLGKADLFSSSGTQTRPTQSTAPTTAQAQPKQSPVPTTTQAPPKTPKALLEFDPAIGPGPISVNKLADRFGEPSLPGFPRHLSRGATLVVICEGIQLELIAPDASWYYEPELVDRALPMKLYSAIVTGGHFTLPRGIRIGDSMEKVRSAYPDPPNAEPETSDGGIRLVYRHLNYDLGYTFNGGHLTYLLVTWDHEI